MEALDRAIKKAGNIAALAQRIGVAASAPSMWKQRGRVPAEHCPAIERETGVRCEELRPDVAWDVLRLQAGEAPAIVTPTYVGPDRRARSVGGGNA